jgi:hypothetical protein
MARLSRLGLLRVTFLALGVLLLLPLYLLRVAFDERIAAQARLRHEVVAERIFDEFERELTRVIERETARPSSAYDSPTDPASWAPFIVGYFTANQQGTRFAPRDAAAAKRRGAVEARLKELTNAPTTTPAAPQLGHSLDQDRTKAEKAPASRSSPEVLRQLNVGSQQRSPAARPSKKEQADPMQDYAF